MFLATLRRKRLFKAFTMIELIVVIVILGILALIAIPTFTQVLNKTKDERSILELQSAAREAVAISALEQEGDRTVALNTWLNTGVPSQAASEGTSADALMLQNVAWQDEAEPNLTTESEIAAAIGAVSTDYRYFSVDLPDSAGTPVGLAMRSAYEPNCVFVTMEASSGNFLGKAVAPWTDADGSPEACKGINAVGMVDAPIDGGDGGTVGAEAIDDEADADLGVPIEIDVLANDRGANLTLVSVSEPSNGSSAVTGNTVTYTPNIGFEGEDTFTYTAASDDVTVSAAVTIHVGHVHEDNCLDTSPVPAVWYPLDVQQGADGVTSECGPSAPGNPATPAGELELPPLTSIGDPVFAETGDGPTPGSAGYMASLTSFPHSNHGFPHYVYGLDADNGSLFWVKDAGVQGVQSAGCATPGEGGAECLAGQLHAEGTFFRPTALLTGQGPGHGTLRSEFAFDTMFVADYDGIWSSSVDAFTGASAPQQIVERSALANSDVNALTGYACFDGTTRVSGDCIWALTTNSWGDSRIQQVNINTGAVTAYPLQGLLDNVASIQPIVVGNEPQFLIGSDSGAFQNFNLLGEATSGLIQPQDGADSVYTHVGNQLYTANATGMYSSPTPQAGAGEVVTRTLNSVSNPDGSMTFTWDQPGFDFSTLPDWSFYIEDNYGGYLEQFVEDGEQSATFTAAELATLDLTDNYFGVYYDTMPARAFIASDSISEGVYTFPLNENVDLTMTFESDATYGNTQVASFQSGEAVTAMHSHGVPGQIYYATNQNENACIRKVTGSTVYTLWCMTPAKFYLNASNTVDTTDGHYLIQTEPIPNATSYTLTARRGSEVVTGTVAANPVPYDRGDAFFDGYNETGSIEEFVYVVPNRTAESGSIVFGYYDNGHFYQNLDNGVTSGTFTMRVQAKANWDGHARISTTGVVFEDDGAWDTSTYERDVVFQPAAGTPISGYGAYYEVELPGFMPYSYTSYSLTSTSNGTFAVDNSHPMSVFEYEGEVFVRTGAEDPADLILPEKTWGPWTVTETANTPAGPVDGGTYKYDPCANSTDCQINS